MNLDNRTVRNVVQLIYILEFQKSEFRRQNNVRTLSSMSMEKDFHHTRIIIPAIIGMNEQNGKLFWLLTPEF